jgi:protein TorT
MIDKNNWGPIDVYDVSSGRSVKTEYRPLEQAINEWNLAVLIPHLKDSMWTAVVYGLVEEARRLGLRLTIHEAGGYDRENAEIQREQFDHCMKANFDAIITAPVSDTRLAERFTRGLEKGIPQVGLMHPITTASVSAQVGPDFDAMGFEAGRYLAEFFQGEAFHVAAFPGPSGRDWTEILLTGFNTALEGSSIKVQTVVYGEPNVAEQLQLVGKILRDFPDTDIIWGTAATAEAAASLIAKADLEDQLFVMSAWENQTLPEALDQLKILGFIAQYPVFQGRIAVDLAVRILEGHPAMKRVRPIQTLVTKGTWSQIDTSGVLAPAGWEVVLTVEPAVLI